MYSDCNIYLDPLSEGNCVISVGECVYVFQPHVFLPFYLHAYDGRLGHI